MGDLVPYAAGRAVVWHGDCFELLAHLPDNSVDSVVTDPPYGLGFMGKAWDDLPPGEPWARECLRVLKPGGHLLAFGGTRTWHRLMVAVEDAGFEVRDSIAWLYGSGFPKSMDVSKAIDKAAGAERKVVGTKLGLPGYSLTDGNGDHRTYSRGLGNTGSGEAECAITAPATPEAEQWQGWGTALKPAFEPIVVARKPLAGTVAANVLAYGTGALNIDGCRIAHASEADLAESTSKNQHARFGTEAGGNQVYGDFSMVPPKDYDGLQGRWPANVVLDESQAAVLDQQSGTLKAGNHPAKRSGQRKDAVYALGHTGTEGERRPTEIGGASRFFYVAKANAKERPTYFRFDCECEGPKLVTVPSVRVEGETCPTCGAGTRKVSHPTVKPLTYMRWLARLVTPPGGLVLDTFGGSGTTGEACLLEGFRVLVAEEDGEHIPLIETRLLRAVSAETDQETQAS